MMTQDTPAEAWENYKNMVQDVCSNEEASAMFEEKNDRLKSELRELVKRTYRSCWKNKAD